MVLIQITITDNLMQIDLKELFGDIDHLDKKILLSLLAAIKENHGKEFDYIKFKKSILSLQEMNIDEITSVKSAYVTASTMGVNKEDLVKSGNQYLTVLVKEKEKFADTLKRQMAAKVDGKLDEAKTIKKTIADHEKRIEQMKKEIALFSKKLEGVDQKAADAKAKIKNTRDKFIEAYDQIYGSVEEDIEKWGNIL